MEQDRTDGCSRSFAVMDRHRNGMPWGSRKSSRDRVRQMHKEKQVRITYMVIMMETFEY